MCRHARGWGERDLHRVASRASGRARAPYAVGVTGRDGHGQWESERWGADPEFEDHRADEPVAPRSDGDLLIADRDRERVIDALKRATTEGRLTIDEFGDRVEETYRARTAADLRTVLRQLPADLAAAAGPAAPAGASSPHQHSPGRRPPPAAAARRGHPLLVVAMVLVVVALASGGQVLAAWPLFWVLFFVARRAWR